jgi:hypothetical protein
MNEWMEGGSRRRTQAGRLKGSKAAAAGGDGNALQGSAARETSR